MVILMVVNWYFCVFRLRFYWKWFIKRFFIVMICVVIIVFFVLIILLFFSGLFIYIFCLGKVFCFMIFNLDKRFEKMIYIFLLLCVYIILFMIFIIVCYYKVFCMVKEYVMVIRNIIWLW